MDLAWLSLAALMAVVAVSCTTRVNPGFVALVLAWAIVALASPLFDQPASQELKLPALFAGFPADLFLTLVGVSVLFAQAESNGALARAAGWAMALCRGNRGLLPILFFLVALGLGTVGPGNIAVAGLIAPVAMAAAGRAGIPPLVMAIMVGHGAIACTLSPLTAGGVVADKILADMGLAGREWQVFAYNAVANAAVAAGGFLLLGGWKLFRGPATDRQSAADAPAIDSPLPLDWRHWITLGVIGLLVVGVVIGRLHVGFGALAGAVLLFVLRLADERETLQKVPWSVILMVCGVSLLASLLDKTGGSKRFAELIGTLATPQSLSGLVALVTGLVSIYSSTTGVVLPAFLPMVKELAAAEPGSDPFALAMSVLIGGNLVDMSPLSTIGALCLAAAPEGIDRRALFNQLLAWGFALALIAAALCWLVFPAV